MNPHSPVFCRGARCRWRKQAWTVILVALIGATGCATPPTPVRRTNGRLVDSARVWFDPTRRPSAADPTTDPLPSEADPLEQIGAALPPIVVSVRGSIAYQSLPVDLDPVAGNARPIANPSSESRYLAVAQLSRGVRIATGERIDTLLNSLSSPSISPASLPARTAALWPGVSAAIRWENDAMSKDESEEPIASTGYWEAVEVVASLSNAAKGSPTPRFSVLLHGLVDASESGRTAVQPHPPLTTALPREDSERAPLSESVAIEFSEPTARFLLWIPIAGRGSEALILLVATESTDTLPASELEAQRTQLLNHTRKPDPLSVWEEFESAIENLQWRASQRRALTHLAESTGCSLARDVALTAPQPFLGRCCEAIHEALVQEARPATVADLGYSVERATYLELAQRLDDGLPPSVEAAMILHAGQVARNPSAVVEIFTVATTLSELPSVLAEANFIGLRHSRASARARAFDWLSRKELAPAGFDPLASATERRQALRAALETWTPDPKTPTGTSDTSNEEPQPTDTPSPAKPRDPSTPTRANPNEPSLHKAGS